MDFIIYLPVTKDENNSIVVFVDWLSKWAYFKAIYCIVIVLEIVKLYFTIIFVNYRLLIMIISNQDTKFTSHFWKVFFNLTSTKLAMSTVYY
jgi:hypothetical protein